MRISGSGSSITYVSDTTIKSRQVERPAYIHVERRKENTVLYRSSTHRQAENPRILAAASVVESHSCRLQIENNR